MTAMAIHPGEQLQEELDALGMSAETLAQRLGIPSGQIVDVLDGKSDIKAEVAMRLGHFFGTSAQFWLNLQGLHDLRLAERLHGAEIEALPTLKVQAA